MNVNVLWTIIITGNQITHQEALKENTNHIPYEPFHIFVLGKPANSSSKINWNKVLQNAWTLPVLEDNISLETPPSPPTRPKKCLRGNWILFSHKENLKLPLNY